MKTEAISVSEFAALLNQTLAFAYPEVVVEGEVASFKLNQNKYVFFDLKDEFNLVGCFMMIYQLKVPLEDGMLVRVKASPQLTKWGKFSLTVKEVELAGEGSAKKAFDLLKAKFEKEGLFAQERKRALPQFPSNVLLITSKQAAAYNDFITILNDRFRGVDIDHIQVQVQGEAAVGQICEAFDYANQHHTNYQVVVLIRGGGSAEDLQAFSSEDIVRAVYASKVPTIVGIGHEDDVSLAELAADQRAATPSDAARRLVPDSKETIAAVDATLKHIRALAATIIEQDKTTLQRFHHAIELRSSAMKHDLAVINERIYTQITSLISTNQDRLLNLRRLLMGLDPEAILSRGYSIARVEGRVIKQSSDYHAGQEVVLQLHQGQLKLVGKDDEKSQQQTSIGF